MTIQINKDWRIRKSGDLFYLEKSDGEEWHYRATHIHLIGVLRAYVYEMYILTPTPTPSDLITLLRKLTAEIEGAVE